jgi:importin subunit beta-1
MESDLYLVYNILSLLNGNDLEKRKSAETELEKLKKNQNLFLVLLKLLDDNSIDLQIRRLAGLILKNHIDEFGPENVDNDFGWLSAFDKDLRSYFKHTLINNLSSQYRIIRRTVSQILGKISFIELKNGLWENIFEEFSEYLSFKNFMSNCYEGILETMEFLFQEFFNGVKFLDLFGIKSPYILNIILDPIKRNNLEQEQLIFSALKTLFTTLHFIKLDGYDCDLIFSLIVNQLITYSNDIRKISFEILELLVKRYYKLVNRFISVIFDQTLTTFEQCNEEVGLKAIEFWSTLADEEFQIILDSIQALSEGRIPKTYSEQFIIKSGSVLPFVLLQFIQHKKMSENEEWNCNSAVGLCLNLMSQAGPNEILSRFVDFIETKVSLNSEIKLKQAAIFSLVSIFDGIGSKVLYNHLIKTSSLWLSFSENENQELRKTTFFLFGKILQLSPFVLRVKLDQILRILLNNIFDKKNRNNIFWILNEIFQSFELEGLLECYLESICSVIYNLISQTTADCEIVDELYEIICSIILNSSIRSQSRLFLLIPSTFVALKSSFISHNFSSNEFTIKIQSHLFRFLGSLIQRFGQKFTKEFLDKLVDFIFFLLEMTSKVNFDSDLENEMIIFFGTVVQKYKKESKLQIQDVTPILFKYIEKNTEHQHVTIAIGFLGDICNSFEDLQHPFIKKSTQTLIDLLQNDSINLDTKPLILSCLGDLCYVSGKYFFEFQKLVIPILKSVIASIDNQEKLPDQDLIQWMLVLKESILESLTGLIQSDPDTSSRKKFFEKNFEFTWLVKSIYDIITKDRILRTTKLSIGLLGDCGANYKAKKTYLSKCTWIKQLISESIQNTGKNLSFMGNWASDSIYEI